MLSPFPLFLPRMMGTPEAISPARSQVQCVPDEACTLQNIFQQYMNGFHILIKQLRSSIREMDLGFRFGQ